MSERVHALVMGRVQGVGFRDFVRREAAALRLEGWVRNRPDGAVEVVAEGASADIERLVERLRRGPMLAHVQRVEVEREGATGEFTGFSIGQAG